MPVETPYTVQGENGSDITLILSGRIDLERFGSLSPHIGRIFDSHKPSRLTVDLAGVDYLDSSGALFLVEFEEEAQKRGVPFTLSGMSTEKKGILSLIDRQSLTAPSLATKERPMNIVEQLGSGTISALQDIYEVISFSGELIYDLVYSAAHLKKVRWGDVVTYMKKVGVDGLPIVGLISFLLGLIIAFMSSLQLKQFGANIYVASLVAVAMVRELGPIMTAIIVAGRSGSAFAAEIGTMKVNEEVDALTTMGFSPMQFLAVPKVIASLLVVPVLTIFSSIFAIMGGLIVGVLGMDLTIYTYIQQTMKALAIFDITSGLVKSFVFAMAISAIGCQRGFKVRGGADAVGNATTSSVVASIFLIIVIDSTFAIILHYI